MRPNIHKLATEIGAILKERKLVLTCTESCTGGMVAAAITEIAGSSAYFDRGFIVYSNSAKHEMLGVDLNLIGEYGAVSEQVAKAMAEGALKRSRADISIAVTGIAGPTGGTEIKPVGTVCFAVAGKNITTQAKTQYFFGDRASVREQATEYALKFFIDIEKRA